MEIWEKVNAAQRMQDYIHDNINNTDNMNENITLDGLCRAAKYSNRHAFRIFKEIFNKTPFEYIRALRLTNAARHIRANDNDSILDVALNAGFSTHEGFAKAFYAYFGVNPGKYRSHVPRKYMYFDPSPILGYYLLLNSKEHNNMAENKRTVTVTVVEKPACKLILKRGVKSTDYFSYCAEMGCDTWEILETVQGTTGGIPFLELPPHMITPGTSKAACAAEVPVDFDSNIPEGFEIVDLPAFLYMWFQGAPYEDENCFGDAHEEMAKTIASYKPELYGYAFAEDLAPHFHYGTSAATGCKEMIPVRRL